METIKLTEFKGIGSQYVSLLKCAGIHTIDELALTNPKNLQSLLSDINRQKHLVQRSPSALQIRAWVARAKEIR